MYVTVCMCVFVLDFDDDGEVKLTENEKEIYLTNKDLCVSQLSRTPIKNKRKSFNYLWHIMNIALFYSIPVVQLVITYQRVCTFSKILLHHTVIMCMCSIQQLQQQHYIHLHIFRKIYVHTYSAFC